MKNSHPCYSFIRSLWLLFSSAEKWELLGSYLGVTWEEHRRNIGGTYAFLSVILRQKESDEHTTLYATRHSKKKTKHVHSQLLT